MENLHEDLLSKFGILVLDNFFEDKRCKIIIDIFLKYQQLGFTRSRQTVDIVPKFQKEDQALFVGDLISSPLITTEEESIKFDSVLLQEFNSQFWNNAYKTYLEHYYILNNFDPHVLTPPKIQQTFPSQGYHLWHCENMGKDTNERILSYILYLNEVDGGETEFLYQSIRIRPKTGRLVVFPVGFQHVHRGNPPLDTAKYIMTGWVVYK